MLKKLFMVALFATSLFAMHTAQININDKDLEVGAKFDIGQFNTAVEPNTTFVGVKFLNPHEDNSDLADNSSVAAGKTLDSYGEVNFLLMRNVGNQGFSFGMGLKLNYTEEFMALPIGFEVGYKIPDLDIVPMSLHGSLYYAPQVLSFLDAKNFLEYRINFDIELIKNGFITLGYRNMDTKYFDSSATKLGNLNYNSSFFFGFKVAF
jgi:hypothetical protein